MKFILFSHFYSSEISFKQSEEMNVNRRNKNRGPNVDKRHPNETESFLSCSLLHLCLNFQHFFFGNFLFRFFCVRVADAVFL